MRNPLGILVTIVFVVVGVGVVRPHTIRLIDEAWEPVARERIEVTLEDRTTVELDQLGDYVLWIEGPASDAQWDTAADTWIQLLDWDTRLPLTSTRVGVDYEYEHEGRRAVGLAKISVSRSGLYELSFGRVDPAALGARGFKVALNPAEQVTDQSRQAMWWMIGGIAAAVVMGIVSLSMLTRQPS